MTEAAKLSDETLLNLLTDCPSAGSLWRHYKTGAVYEVVGSAIAESTQKAVVLYRPVGGKVLFCRPAVEWRQSVFLERGGAGQRFTLVDFPSEVTALSLLEVYRKERDAAEDRYHESLARLRESCPHMESTDWLVAYDSCTWRFYEARVCKRCHKEMERRPMKCEG